jgi:hypothetical protein
MPVTGRTGHHAGQRIDEEPVTSAPTAGATARHTQRYQLDSGIGGLTPTERAARGKAAGAIAAALEEPGR